MFDATFVMLFRAVDRIRIQLESADPDLRQLLTDELSTLQRAGEQCIDRWMTLDAQIEELYDTFSLQVQSGDGEATQASFGDDGEELVPGGVSILTQTTASSSGPLDLVDTSTMDLPDTFTTEWESMAFQFTRKTALSFRRGMGYYDLAMYDEAADALTDVVEASRHPVARIYLAAAHAAKHRWYSALDNLAAVRSQTQHTLLLCATDEIEAQVHLAEHRTDDAIHRLLDIARRMPNYQDVWFNLAVCYAHKGDLGAAEHAALQALDVQPDDLEAIRMLAAIRLHRHHLDEASQACRQGIELAPRHVPLLLLNARILQALGQWDDSIRATRQVIATDPSQDEAWSLMVWSMLRAGRLHDAAAALKQQLSLCPNHADAMAQLGIVLMLQKDYGRAEQVLLKSLVRTRDKAAVWIALGRVSANRGSAKQAYTRFLRAMKDPRKSVKRLALYYYGTALYTQGHYKVAEKYLRAAAILGAPNAAIFIALGRTAEQMGRRHEAEKYFARAQAPHFLLE